MPPIYIMAALTLAIVVALTTLTLRSWSYRQNRYWILVLAGLPLSYLVNVLVKAPFLRGLSGLTGIPLSLSQLPWWFLLIVLFTPPVTEEAVKLLPLLLPGQRKHLKSAQDALVAGLALGFGFGLGEILYLAYGVANAPMYAGLPWYAFTGFLTERIVATFAHGFMTAQTTLGISRGGWKGLRGYGIAILMHALINAGALVVALGWIKNPQIASLAATLSLWVIVALFFVLVQRQVMRLRKQDPDPEHPDELVYYNKEGHEYHE